jgi:hypothetical protein
MGDNAADASNRRRHSIGQLAPQPVEFNEPLDRAQKVPFRHVIFERKFVKQSVLPNAASPHH